MASSYATWKGWESKGFGECSNDLAAYYDLELRKSGLPNVAGMRIAEVGFGNGEFAGWAVSRGASWIGIEAAEELRSKASAAGFEVLPANASLADAAARGGIDLILAFDVLEHLSMDQIESVLRDSFIALRQGGAFLARMPSGDSPYSGAIFCGDPTHTSLLGSSTIRYLAARFRFRVDQIRPPAVVLLGAGPVRAVVRLVRRILQAIVYWFVRNVVMADSSAVVSPNMVIVLRKEESTR